MLVSAQNIQNIKKYCQFATFNHSTFRQLLAANWVVCCKGGTACGSWCVQARIWSAWAGVRLVLFLPSKGTVQKLYRPGHTHLWRSTSSYHNCLIRPCWVLTNWFLINLLKNTFRGHSIHGYSNSTTSLVIVLGAVHILRNHKRREGGVSDFDYAWWHRGCFYFWWCHHFVICWDLN